MLFSLATPENVVCTGYTSAPDKRLLGTSRIMRPHDLVLASSPVTGFCKISNDNTVLFFHSFKPGSVMFSFNGNFRLAVIGGQLICTRRNREISMVKKS